QHFAAGEQLVAIRFAPGCGPRVFGASGEALRNARVDLNELWGDSAKVLAEQLSRENDVARQRTLLERAAHLQLMAAGAIDSMVLEIVRRLSGTCEVPSVAQ